VYYASFLLENRSSQVISQQRHLSVDALKTQTYESLFAPQMKGDHGRPSNGKSYIPQEFFQIDRGPSSH